MAKETLKAQVERLTAENVDLKNKLARGIPFRLFHLCSNDSLKWTIGLSIPYPC